MPVARVLGNRKLYNKVSAPLTAMELRIAQMIGEGLRNREIAERLERSPETVKTHLARIFDKTGCETRLQLAVRYARNRIPAAQENAATISMLCCRVERMVARIRALNGEIV